MPYSTAKASIEFLESSEVSSIFNDIMEEEISAEKIEPIKLYVPQSFKVDAYPFYISIQAQLESYDFLRPPCLTSL